jgi:hypothetical protein
MHVQCLAIASRAINDDRDNDELVLGHKVPYASLVLWRFVARMRLDVELERVRQWEEEEQ